MVPEGSEKTEKGKQTLCAFKVSLDFFAVERVAMALEFDSCDTAASHAHYNTSRS